jgi:hypothetical protein
MLGFLKYFTPIKWQKMASFLAKKLAVLELKNCDFLQNIDHNICFQEKAIFSSKVGENRRKC